MKRFQTQGTLGDAYICACKVNNIPERVILYHRTIHRAWWAIIQDILQLPKNVVDVRFVDEVRKDLVELTSDTHEQQPDFFPNFEIEDRFVIKKPYIVLQPHAGKLKGGNAKYFPYELCNNVIMNAELMNQRCVILGLHPKYKGLENCINLIGKTTVLDTMAIIKRADRFIGPEGFMAMVALSNRVYSDIAYADYKAVERRIVDTPWAKYLNTLEKM